MSIANKKSILQLKIEKRVYKFLSDMFLNSDISINNNSYEISICLVDISPDLKNLKIYLDSYGMLEKDKKLLVKKLNLKNNIFYIKDAIAKHINLKFVPNVQFFLDTSRDKLEKIEKIIEKEKEKYN